MSEKVPRSWYLLPLLFGLLGGLLAYLLLQERDVDEAKTTLYIGIFIFIIQLIVLANILG